LHAVALMTHATSTVRLHSVVSNKFYKSQTISIQNYKFCIRGMHLQMTYAFINCVTISILLLLFGLNANSLQVVPLLCVTEWFHWLIITSKSETKLPHRPQHSDISVVWQPWVCVYKHVFLSLMHKFLWTSPKNENTWHIAMEYAYQITKRYSYGICLPDNQTISQIGPILAYDIRLILALCQTEIADIGLI